VAKFTDKDGRDWLIRVDVTAIKAVRNQCEIDLGNIGEAPEYLTRLADDPVLLCDLLFILCEEQVKQRELSDADFGRLLVGDVIAHATMALGEAIADFFPAKKRSFLRQIQQKLAGIQTTAENLAQENLDDPTLEKELGLAMKNRMEEAKQHALTQLRSVTNSPESSAESMPAP